MASKSAATFFDWAYYLGWRALECAVTALPWKAARHAAACLGELACALDRPTRKAQSARDLMLAFPDLDAQGVLRLQRGVYRHLAESILDALKFAQLIQAGRTDGLVVTEGFEKLDALPRRTGIVFVTGHFGHWEVLGLAGPLVGYPTWALARGRSNPYLERRISRLRELSGQRILPRRHALGRAVRLLRQGQNVAVLIDQDARKEGIFVDFFGRPASTTPIAARLAFRTGAPVALVIARRLGDQNRFKLVLEDLIFPRQGADRDAEIYRITQQLTHGLERLVRQHPHEWLWLHRRWKTYPGKYPSQRLPTADLA